MLHRVFLPRLGQTMEEGTIEKWHKAEGDTVEKGDVLYELTTDKATLEVEAFVAGTLRKILADEGETVAVNELIAVVGDPNEELPDDLGAGAAPTAEAEVEAPAEEPATGAAATTPAASTAPATSAAPATAGPPGRIFASPRARKVAEENMVTLEALTGSGPGGRIIERDVREYLDALNGVSFTPTARAYAHQQGVDLLAVARGTEGRIEREDVERAVAEGVALPAARAGERIELSPMRQTIAERMTESKQTVPHFYLVGQVEMGGAMDLLARLKEESPVKLTVTALLVRAVGLALREHPRVNARFDGDAVVLNRECNVGVAVAVEDGLFVPVVRGADRKSVEEIAPELRSLAEAAREGRLIPEQYEGGSITISNLGMYGVDYFQAIINPPESCIIGIGRIREEPMAGDGKIWVGRVMDVSISADHRAIDGVQAAEFFQTLKGLLEEPERVTG
jgi:pyruvate dehydrogenase E2 component (dihydrolipoamide acetyltransferase)